MIDPPYLDQDNLSSSEILRVGVDNRFKFRICIIGKIPRAAYRFKKWGVARAQESKKPVLKGAYPVNRKGIKIAIDSGVDHAKLLLHP
jgi:hypothetical protein